MEVGDEGKAESDGGYGGYVGINLSVSRGDGQSVQPSLNDTRGQRFAEPAQGQRAKGDAELDGGEKVVQVALQAANGAGAGDGGGQHLLDAGVAERDKGELGGHKEGVSQDEQADSDELEQRKTGHLGCEDSIKQGIGNRE